MAEITDMEAIRFCNDRIRSAANRFAQAYYHAKIVQQEWFANTMSALIPDDSSPVIDGSLSTGDHKITGADATAVVTRCIDFVADMEANANAKLNTILAVATQPNP